MSDDAFHGLMRAAGTVVAALVALPFVAWLEGLRGRAHALAPGVVAGPRGALTAIATAIKLLEKRSPRGASADRLIHATAPVLVLIPTLAVPAIIPLEPNDRLSATLPFALALSLVSTAAVALAGFGGGSGLAHLAGLRLVALRLSVLVVLAAASMAAIHGAGTVELPALVRAQSEPLFSFIPRWSAILAPTSFLAGLLALAIHAQHVLRARSDASLAETWLGDASGPVLLGHRLFETLDLLAGACLLAVIFLGGWHVPGLDLPYVPATIFKVGIVLVGIIATRNILPALTPAVALRVCWIVLLPMAVFGLVVLELL